MMDLTQGSTNIFGKGPNTKYCSFCKPCVLLTAIRLCHCGVKAVTENVPMNGRDYMPINQPECSESEQIQQQPEFVPEVRVYLAHGPSQLLKLPLAFPKFSCNLRGKDI